MKATTALLLLLILISLCASCTKLESTTEPHTIQIFRDNVIHFTPDDSSKYDTAMVSARDNGRQITTTLEMQRPSYPVTITARVDLRPIRKDIRNVHDHWDRAGNVRLSRAGMADLEIVKFVTSYGGVTDHTVDVSHLAPLLDGSCTFVGFIDTWVTPAWEMDFTLTFSPMSRRTEPVWVEGILFAESVTAANLPPDGLNVTVDVPEGIQRVVMHYFTSGHCTDGIDADEFQSKDNVIGVDGREVFRFRPWRDDCRQFRAINPYCARWSDGSWSSDHSRSGWCPGDEVLPVALDLSEYLTPGRHSLSFAVEDIRPRGKDGHHGYWRLSSHLLGWRR
jgi:hypothetical protein